MPLEPHDVLAGPIVRRVQPDLVSVWIALRKPATVRLQVFRGLGPRNALTNVPALPVPDGSGVRGIPPDPHTLAVGQELHIAVAVMEPAPPTQLEWGQIFSYDLRMKADEDGPGGEEYGLGELGLLTNNDIVGLDGRSHAHLALGYTPGWLPSFVLPAELPMQLRFAHGSCRFPTGEGKDTMPELDGLIGASQSDPLQRIQMLFLTGDQIYADDTGPEYGQVISPIAARLIGGATSTPVEKLMASDEGDMTQVFPIDRLHFPVGRRQHLISNTAGFTSDHLSASMMGLGEFSAMYLTMWSNVLWPDLEPMLAGRWERVDAYRTHTRDLRAALKAIPHDVPDEVCDRIPYYEAWRLVPPEDLDLDAYVPDAERTKAWGEEGGKPDVWGPFWAASPHPEYKDPPRFNLPHKTAPDQLEKLAPRLTPSWFAGVKHYGVDIDWTSGPEGRVAGDEARDNLQRMHWFYEGLPRVRRALANVATYMIFDDHDVSDDWNINLKWERAMRDSPLGRGIVRNALASYTLFQGWGNDPRAYAVSDSIANQILTTINLLFHRQDGSLWQDGPEQNALEKLEKLFDLQRTTSAPLPVDQRMRWDYRYQGAGFEVIVLDTRTWRGYEQDADPGAGEPFGEVANAPLMTTESMQLQIPADPSVGVAEGFTIVVSAAPVLGYPAVESLFQPILNIHDLAKLPPQGTFATLRRPYEFIGREGKDPEPWGYVPRAFEALLARLRNRRRVIFLSGDVHYSCTLSMSYWAGPPPMPQRTRFVQLTSSAFLNQQPITRVEYFSMELAQQVGGALSDDIERMAWVKGMTGSSTAADPVEPPPPDESGQSVDFNARVKHLLTVDPILLPPRALPPHTRQVRDPDWSWRFGLQHDERPDDERLAGLPLPPLLPATAGIPAMAQSASDRHRWQPEHAPARSWVWFANFGVVDFLDGATPSVRHSLYCYDLGGLVETARPYTVVEVPLDVPADEQPPRAPE
jgi:hypothetical protein